MSLKPSKFSKPVGAEAFIKNDSDSNIDTASDISINTGIDIDTNTHPWQKHNKKSIKKKIFNLKINEYYLESIRYFSNPEEGLSMQQIVQEILIKELDKRIKEIETKN